MPRFLIDHHVYIDESKKRIKPLLSQYGPVYRVALISISLAVSKSCKTTDMGQAWYAHLLPAFVGTP